MDITTWSQLKRALEAEVVFDLNKIGEEVKSWLRNNIRLLWYERKYEPKNYTRTFELIDCLEIRKAQKLSNGM